MTSETRSLVSAETPEGGFIRLAQWPEGFVLWYHGEIVWKSWEKVGGAAIEVSQEWLDTAAKAIQREADALEPFNVNQFIDEEMERITFNGEKIPVVPAKHAAELVREVALRVIFDKATLITNLANHVHAANVMAGWWTNIHTGEDLHGKRNIGELLALVHSEISEALEGWRKNQKDDKLPHRPMFRVELIDAMIRILDILGSEQNGPDEHPAGTIFVEKFNFNATRPDHKPENRLKADGKKI